MAKTHDVGRLYWHTMVYPRKFKGFTDRAESQEIEVPFRAGSGFVLRLPFTRLGLVLGVWSKPQPYDESIALTRAISARFLGEDEVTWNKIRGIDVKEEEQTL